MLNFVNPKQAAQILKCSVSKLNKGRCMGTLDIPFIKIGHQVLYDEGDLLKWLEAREGSTGGAGGAGGGCACR